MIRMLAIVVVVAALGGWCCAAWAQEVAPEEQRISLDLKDADIRSALDMLFKSKPGSSYVLDSAVAGMVNMKLDDATWLSALRAMLRSANLDYRMEDNIYHILPKASATGTSGASPMGGTSSTSYGTSSAGGGTRYGTSTTGSTVTTVGGRTSRKFELVTVRYSDPAQMAALFGGTAVGFASSGQAGGYGSGLGGFSGYGGMGGGYGGGMMGGGYGGGGYGGGGYGGGGMGFRR